LPQRGTELIGRASELAVAEEALAALERGDGAVLAFEGEPGIGKTRLLAELGERADERRWLMLDGRASELEADVPFGPLLDALDDYLASLNRRVVESLGTERLAELAAIFPSLAELGDGARPGLGAERFRLHRAVEGLLAKLAGQRPVVILLDDLHWADPATVELVARLVERRPQPRVLIGLAYRSGQAPATLAAALARGQREHGVALHRVEPLSLADAERLVGPDLPTELRERLREESGGNPLYLQQLARAPALPHGSGGVPELITAAVAEELRSASRSACALANGAAIVGDQFDLDLAAVAAGVAPADAAVLGDELLALELVQPTTAPLRLRFRHPIVRRAVYETTPAAWRSGAHARVAEALAKRGAGPMARAHHVERSAQPGDMDAAHLLGEAADAAAPAHPRRRRAGSARHCG